MPPQEPPTIESPTNTSIAPPTLPLTAQTPSPETPTNKTPTMIPTQPSLRPGRKQIRQSPDINVATSYGDPVDTRDPSHIRVFFQNVKGLTYSATGQDYEYYTSCIANIDADITGMAETNSAWQHHHLKSKFKASIQKHFPMTKIAYSSPSNEIDPMPEKESYQAGGTVTFTIRKMVTLSHGQPIIDPTGLGRWSGLHFRGKDNKKFTTITAYRVCTSSINSAPIGSSFAREYEYFKAQGITSPRPRKIFLTDLANTITTLQSDGHAVLLMMDSNGQISDDADLQAFISECDLADLHQHSPAPSTYIGSPNRRIDHMLGCKQVLDSLQGSGSLSYIEGPQSDHRGLFVDLQPATLLGQDTDPIAIAQHKTRILKSGNPEAVESYNAAMLQYYTEHNMVERIEWITQNINTLDSATTRKLIEEWDQDQGRAMKHAEKQLSRTKKPHQWSPALRNAGLLYRYWRLRHREATTGTDDYSHTYQRILDQTATHDPSFRLPHLGEQLTKEAVTTHLNAAGKHLKKIQKDSVELRYKCYLDLLAVYANDKNGATKKESERKYKIVKNTIAAEECRTMYSNIRNTVKPSEHSGLHRLLVPRHATATEPPTDFQKFLETTNEEDIMWDSILDKTSIDTNLLKFNRNHFRAASISPCGHGLIHQQLTFNSLSPEAQAVLDGNIPQEWHEDNPLLREFLLSFSIPDQIKKVKPIKTTLTTEDVRYGIGKWKEKTSTSPSGRHLGHYKAIIQEETLLTCMTQFLNATIQKGLTLDRWCNAVNVMIEKDPGSPRLTRLRIIHLFEADFNLFLKLQWGSRLVKRAAKHDLIHTGQHGSVPRRKTMDPIMLTQLTSDLCRLMKHNLARFDNDASACYDRIIVALGMLAARRFGMPDNAIKTHADSLKFMRYAVKTMYGISEENYKGTPFEPLFGTGQGSGASPAVWLTLIILLMETLDRIIPERTTFISPDSKTRHSRLIDAFVDDTSLGFSDPGYMTLETLVAKLTNIAQTWEQLLYFSGGSLNLKKCFWYVLYWDWEKGKPTLRKMTEQDPTLSLTTQGKDQSIPITRLEPEKASRILGVHLSPLGDFSTQLQILRKKADNFAIRLRSPRLTPTDVATFHRTTYAPTMKYVLPAMSVDEEELATVQTKVLQAMLNKLGYSTKTPIEIRHGPMEMGGLDLLDLRTEVGIAQLQYFRDSIFTNSEAGKLLLINVKYMQLESGILPPLLENPHIRISYLTPTWTTSLRQFLYQHNLQISLSDSLNIKLRGKFDECIMNIDHLTRYTPQQQNDINLVRIYLQVITRSDMSTTNKDICPFQSAGKRRPNQRIRKQTWPRQPLVTPSQQRIWSKYISSNFLRYGLKWRQPVDLGTHLQQPKLPTSYDTLSDYLRSLSPHYQRLLYHYEQEVSDNEVWKAFRSKQRLTIASDGSLLSTAGTFGWKLTTSKHVTLFFGSGPIDGPIEIGSSTRSELGGFTGPLLLVTILARFWGLRHKCKFRWLVDSKIAINRVQFVTSKDHRPTKQPDNIDLLSTIRDLHKELRRPLKAHWIKSHQDNDQEYDKLSPDAQLNVDADDLATKFHKRPRAKPLRNTEHLPSTQVSISINQTRYYGNLDANLRFHINGGYLRNFLQNKHNWTNEVWDKVDLPAFGRNLKRLAPKHKVAHIKFVHGLLPLGVHVHQRSKIDDPKLKLCPCCNIVQEDHHHYLRCAANIKREAALFNLTKDLIGTDSHPFGLSLAICIDYSLKDKDLPSQFPLDKHPTSHQEAISQAINDQSQIGFPHILRGFLATSWQTLASVHVNDPTKIENSKGRHRIQQALNSLHEFTREVWLGRNAALHEHNDTADALIYTAESAELRHFHADPSLLPSSDRHYLNLSLNKLLQSNPSVRRRWLRRVRNARANFVKDGRSQQTLAGYITSISTISANPPPATTELLINATAHARTKTTQQRLTDFFTGRPPDHHNTSPRNPSHA